MITQRETLTTKIKFLEKELSKAVLLKDAFVQIELYQALQMAKSTLLNLD